MCLRGGAGSWLKLAIFLFRIHKHFFRSAFFTVGVKSSSTHPWFGANGGKVPLTLLIQKPKGRSGAFIKELMRRSAQFLVESGEKALRELHIESALDEMLFSGGSLNAKLLGFSQKN